MSQGAEMTLIEQLRAIAWQDEAHSSDLYDKAADAIQALQAENERIESELNAAVANWSSMETSLVDWRNKCRKAEAERDALAAKLVPLTDEHIKAAHICHQAGRVSVSMVQRKLATGYNRAQQLVTEIVSARLVDGLEVAGLPNSAHGIQAKGGQHEDA
jgi:DNA segregation ATPase FtsK/SpoIIIE-like protein